MPTCNTFHFVRHGYTDPFMRRLFCGGSWDVPLNDKGSAQVRHLSELHRTLFQRVTKIIAAPMKRTIQTAIIVAGPRASDVIQKKDLAEWRLGEWEGKKWEEMPSLFDETVEPTGGETRAEFQSRISGSMTSLANQYDDFLVVSHGLVWRAVTKTFGLPDTEIGPCGLVSVQRVDDVQWRASVLHPGYRLEND